MVYLYGNDQVSPTWDVEGDTTHITTGISVRKGRLFTPPQSW